MSEGRSTQTVYRCQRADYWDGDDHPLLSRHLHFARGGQFPAGRWNDADLDALYTSHDPETALVEALEHVPRSLAASDLADTGQRLELVVIALPAPMVASPRVHDAIAAGVTSRRDIGRLMAPAAIGGYRASRAYARRFTQRPPFHERLVVPSAPRFRAGQLAANSAFYFGPRHLPDGALPAKARCLIIQRHRVR